MMKRLLETTLLASRWLLAPLLVMMAATQIALMFEGAMKVYKIATLIFTNQHAQITLAELNLIDIALTSALVVIVTISVYENFVSRVTSMDRSNWPSWMGEIDFWQLKLKLMTTIIAISAIKLLEAFVEVAEESDRDLYFYIGIHLTFVVSTLILAVAQRLAGHGAPAAGEPPKDQ
jgi:uncharacterized protein (TIGR00645 family)